MSIEIKNKKAEKFSVHCYSCWSLNEENGNYGPAPLEFWWLPEETNLSKALDASSEHEQSDNKNHQIIISGY